MSSYIASYLRWARGRFRARRRYRARGLLAFRPGEAPGTRVALAAVHDDVGTGDPRCPPGQQERDDVGDLLRAPQPPERELRVQEGGEVSGVLLREPLPRTAREEDRARAHRVHPDVVRG